jgi:hypothetical protein
LHDVVNGGDEFLDGRDLEHVSGRSGSNCVHRQPWLGVQRQNHHLAIRSPLSDLPDGIESIQERHGGVGRDYVWSKRFRRLDQGTAVMHNSNELKAIFQQGLKTLRDHGMIVCKEHAGQGHRLTSKFAS